MGIKVFNTLSGKKEEFVPIQEGKVGIYVCGVTVYDLCHIGHARSQIVFDVIVRYLRYKGYEVKYVRNFTDVDDKIIKRANEEGVSSKEIAERYIEEYYRDFKPLNLVKPDVEPRVTEHIDDIIEVVKILIDKGFAYEVEGDVYYSVRAFPEYGKLSKRSLDEMIAGARVEPGERKKDPLDFALWKRSKPGEPAWDSPWGKGRPGWHIECTVMSTKYLGKSFDIHGGGMDLIFPHHENEIAQAEGAFGVPYVKYWIHNGFVNIDKEKMSKSTGKFFTLREVLERYHPEVLRLFLISTHYRSPIDFSEDKLKETWRALFGYYGTLMDAERWAEEFREGKEEYGEKVLKLKERFEDAMDDDFNTARAVGCVFEAVEEIARAMKTPKVSFLLKRFKEVIKDVGNVLGVFTSEPHEFYSSSNRILGKVRGVDVEKVEEMVSERESARRAKDFKRADSIRDELKKLGVRVEDTPWGTRWRFEI